MQQCTGAGSTVKAVGSTLFLASLMEIEFLDVKVEVVVGPNPHPTLRPDGFGVGGIDRLTIHLEGDLAGVLLGIDLENIGCLTLRIALLDGGVSGPSFGDLAGVFALALLDEVSPIVSDQEVGVLLIFTGERLPTEEQSVPPACSSFFI